MKSEISLTPCHPSVTVIVCTRNRRHNVVFTAQSILASDYPNMELLIVDQSDDDATQQALAPLLAQEKRLRSIKMETPGKPLALNRARKEAIGEIFALTDDDCVVDANWIDALVDCFQSDVKIGCVMGEVIPAPHDTSLGYIGGCHQRHTHSICHLRDFFNPFDGSNYGMGANLAVRSEVVAQIDGWDPCIGPGTRFGSGDDHDLVVRVLLAGYSLHFCAEAKVVHHGFRLWEHAVSDLRRWGFGSGATFAKYFRCGILYYGALRKFSETLCVAIRNGFLFRRPLGLTLPINWICGLLAGSIHPIDRDRRLFHALDLEASQAFGDHFAVTVLREPNAGSGAENRREEKYL